MSRPKDVLVEAESFAERGGWVMDQQSIAAMGSAYLLAHGLGEPVANARMQVLFPAAGRHRLWVRTRDWAPPHGPGRFRLRLGGRPVAKVFGIEGDGTWQWHDGGMVDVAPGESALELEDLTGFEARCDAILFTRAGQAPPNGVEELARFRRQALGLPEQPQDAGQYDLVVAGGGLAGVCAAVAGARLGLKVALIQDRPVLGGNASSEVRVGPMGGLDHGPFPRNADIIKEILANPGAAEASGGFRAKPNDEFLLSLVRREPNITLRLETHVTGMEKWGSRIAALVGCDLRTSRQWRFGGTLFADCTGDATVGFLTGADWRMGREGRDQTGEALAAQADRQLLGTTNMWAARATGRPTTFPDCPWALRVTEESREVSTPRWPAKLADYVYLGGWNWESGFGRDPIGQAEAIRDHNFRAIYGMWDFLKNRASGRDRYATAKLVWAAHIAGKRESRRLLGDVILTQQDMAEPRIYPDACVTATWYFDAHFPHPQNSRHFPGQEFRSLAYDDPRFEEFRGPAVGSYTTIQPYPIPFRCLYSRSLDNLFMAGRNISVTHVALLPVRTMNTTAMMGTVVGRAAYLCCKFGVAPRGLYEAHLEDLKRLLAHPAP